MTTEHSGSGDITRSLELLWSGKEQPSRGPRPGLTLDHIVVTAVGLANREGLPALSMRKVATELGVGTMTLYRYVPGKGELLDLMLDHVNGPGEDLEQHRGKGWRNALEISAEGSWTLYTQNPWLLQVNQVRPVLGPNSMAGFELALAALDDVPLTGQEKVRMLTTLDAYMVGVARTHVLQQQAAAQTGLSDEDFWTAQVPYLERAMASGAYPRIAALPEDSFSTSGEEAMRFGLRALLDGFQSLIDGRKRE